MASARERNGRWTALYKDRAGSQRSAGTFDSKRAALRAAKASETLEKAGVNAKAALAKPELVYRDAVRGKATVSAYARAWLEGLSLEPNTRATYQNSLRHITGRIGGLTVAGVQPDDIRAIVRHLEKLRRKDSTIRHVLTVARLMFESAVRSKLRADNPCDGIRHKIKDRREMMIATRAQRKAIEEAIDSRYRLLTRLLFVSGCRWSEAIALRGTDVEERDGTWYLKVRRTACETWEAGSGVTIYTKDYGKSARSMRDISIPKGLALELAAYGNSLCFTNTVGGYLRRADFRQRVWKPATAKAGIPGLRVHDARHTAISAWCNAGISLVACRDRAGHSNISVTSTYLHFNGDDPFAAVFEEAA